MIYHKHSNVENSPFFPTKKDMTNIKKELCEQLKVSPDKLQAKVSEIDDVFEDFAERQDAN